jgi:hypothetical protein
MADKKSLNKQIPSSITYPNPYAEGEVFTPSNVSIGQETIRKNIPLGLGMPQSPPSVPSAMPNQNVIRNAGIQMLPEEQMLKEPSDDSSSFLGSLIAQGIAGIGTGLMGGDSYAIQRSASMFQRMRDRQENEKKAKLFTDPKSEESKKQRLIYKSLGYDVPDNLSYTDLRDPVVLQSIRNKNMQTIPQKSGIGMAVTKQAKQEKEKKNPFQKEINQINIFANNGLQALDELEKIIQEKGTTEIFGPQETKINQLASDIAKSKTKILDPNSVISTAEIESVKNDLGLGGMNKYFANKNTTIEGIKSFKTLLKNNRDNAMKSYYNLPGNLEFNDKDNFIIEEYRNNPNDPDVKEAYNNMMISKGLQ